MLLFRRSSSRAVSFFVLVMTILKLLSVEASLFPCNQTAECEVAIGPGSFCGANGLCTNAYYNGGCLKSTIGWNKTRICNSDDPPEAETLGFCRKSPMEYFEVRMAGRNWESANFVGWILQILLSEFLDIPTSMESGVPDLKLNFYDEQSSFEYWNSQVSDDFSEFSLAAEVGDCRMVPKSSDPDEYQSCFHVYQELWPDDYPQGMTPQGVEPFQDLGVMGENSIFVPLFAVEKDPTLTSYVGLKGQENRRKVAETFKRPTRWGQYCREVSVTKCTEPDPLAQRAPVTDEEENSFFVAGMYNGHFRHTEESNCDKYPLNCTGAFIDYPW